MATVTGRFSVFTEGESPDLSVLGPDVTNNFSVIYDYARRVVALLAPPHFYSRRVLTTLARGVVLNANRA
jgi:hypothetical protein